jgi:hypothetical protein
MHSSELRASAPRQATIPPSGVLVVRSRTVQGLPVRVRRGKRTGDAAPHPSGRRFAGVRISGRATQASPQPRLFRSDAGRQRKQTAGFARRNPNTQATHCPSRFRRTPRTPRNCSERADTAGPPVGAVRPRPLPADVPAEDEADVVGPADPEIVGNDLVEEDPPGDRPVEDLGGGRTWPAGWKGHSGARRPGRRANRGCGVAPLRAPVGHGPAGHLPPTAAWCPEPAAPPPIGCCACWPATARAVATSASPGCGRRFKPRLPAPLGTVSPPGSLVLIGEPLHGNDRAEHLVLDDLVIPAQVVHREPLPPGEHPGMSGWPR